MTREEIYRQAEQRLGEVPTWFEYIPDAFLEHEWNTWQAEMTTKDTAIPMKWQQLICVGIAAAIKDEYSVLWCTESAKAAGATDEEIREAVYLTKSILGWDSFLKGNQVDYEQFKQSVQRFFRMMGERGVFQPTQTREKSSI